MRLAGPSGNIVSPVVLLLVVGSCSLLFTKPLSAEEAPPRTVEQARQRFREAVELFDRERYEEARRAFEEVRTVRAHPLVTYNIGWCLSRLGREREAVDEFERFLEQADERDGDRITRAREELSRLRERFDAIDRSGDSEPAASTNPARLVVRTSPEGAEVLIDGEVVGRTPYEGDVEPGDLEIRIDLSGYEVVTERLSLEPDQERELAFSLARLEESPSSRRRLHRGWFWAAFGLTVATGAAATVIGCLTLDLSDRWQVEGRIEDRENGRTLRAATDGLLIALGGEAIVALLLGLFTDFHSREREGEEDR